MLKQAIGVLDMREIRVRSTSVGHTCNHVPRCPAPSAPERLNSLVAASHPEQGWNLLCNGVVLFDDGGALLPTGEAIAPPRTGATPSRAA